MYSVAAFTTLYICETSNPLQPYRDTFLLRTCWLILSLQSIYFEVVEVRAGEDPRYQGNCMPGLPSESGHNAAVIFRRSEIDVGLAKTFLR